MLRFIKKLLNIGSPIGKIQLAVKVLTLINNLIMAEKKGILSRKDERWLAKFIDSALKLKGFAELIDGAIIRGIIAILDNVLIEKHLPDEWENPLEKMIEAAKNKDTTALAELIDAKIDVPFVDGIAERAAVEGAVRFLSGIIYKYVDSIDIEDETVE